MKVKIKILWVLLAILIFVCFACDGTKNPSIKDSNPNDSSYPSEKESDNYDTTTKPKAEVKVANGEDKILQSYDYNTTAYKNLKSKFMDGLEDSISMIAFRNEYESRQLIITPTSNVSYYYVSVSDLKCGENSLSADNIDVRHEYYHSVDTIYDTASEMLSGMYPDALLPMRTAADYSLNKITVNNNQGVYITAYIPKNQKAGIYTGKVKVILNGTTIEIPISVTVLDYTLPDSVSLKSCIPLQVGFLYSGELDNTAEMYGKYVDSLTDFRLAVQYLSPYYDESSSVSYYTDFCTDYVTDLAVEATKNQKVSSYAIKVYTVSDPVYSTSLNKNKLLAYLKAYANKSKESGLNLFSKAYVYMGNIIDEPGLDSTGFGARKAQYVCTQYNDTISQAVSYATEIGCSSEVINSLSLLPHVVTCANADNLSNVQTYCPMADTYSTSAILEDYQSLRTEGKDYWWYTCTQPKIPYPTVHLDDNGVSSRVMCWMAKEYQITGYLTWEAAYYYTALTNTAIKGIDLYKDVHRWSDAYGDGWFFYPGYVYGIDGPVPSLRLYTIRDGMEDYEALKALETIYDELSNDYGATINSQGIVNELYSMLYNDNKVYCNSNDVEKAKELLSQLLVLANKGVAVSDYRIDIDGKVKANIYAPADMKISVSTQIIEGTVSGIGKKYVIDAKMDELSLTSNGNTFEIDTQATVLDVISANNFKNTNGVISDSNIEGLSAVKVQLNNKVLLCNVASGSINSSTKSLLITIYSETSEKIKTSVALFNGTMEAQLDTVYLHPGYNVIRVDRIDTINWKVLRNVSALRFTFEQSSAGTLDFVGLVKCN